MICHVRSLSVKTVADAERELASLRIDPFTIRNLGPKMIYRLIRIDGIDGREGAALKQEMLALGGDAAVGRCGLDYADQQSVVILMGTEKQLRKLCISLSHHPLGFSMLAGEIIRLLDMETDPPSCWNTGRRVFDFTRRLCVMGILNVTPDSFSDGNRYCDLERAVDRAFLMEAEGADIIDIGGESTRPFAPAVPEEEELRRVMPLLERLKGQLKVPISIDTYKSRVAREALAAGAEIVNDISALSFDERMVETVAEADAGLVLMHTRGRPAEMQKNTDYASLIDEVVLFLKGVIGRAEAAGIALDRIVVDPGIGFGKNIEGNLAILARLAEFSVLGRPLLVGTSRKGFIGKILGRETGERIYGTAATVALAVANGASIFRVHDVKAMRDVIDMAFAVTRVSGGSAS